MQSGALPLLPWIGCIRCLEWDVTFSRPATMHCPAVPLRHLSALILAAFSALPLLTACGGGSGPSPNPNATTVVTPPSTTGSSSIGMDISSTTVTINQPATVTATLLDAQGNPLANRVLKFAVDASLATLTPSSGTVLTDSKGMARVQLNAASLSANGAGYVTASIKLGDTDISQTQGFQLGAANVSLGNISLGSGNISAYATTGVNVPVLVNGSASGTSIPVSFTSLCAQTGKASIDSTVSSISGVASATYTDKGCAGSDTITASINDGAQSRQATLQVQAPAATSLQYSSVAPADGVITLRGYGTAARPEAAQVKFRLVDAQGNGVAGRTLQFSLSTSTGGIRFDNQQQTATAVTNAQGEATVTVQSGTLPTPVRIVASEAGSGLSTQSSGLSVSSGLPDQDSMSVSVKTLNMPGWDVDNVENTITISLADHFNNPVPDGTAVTVVSNGGRIGNGTTGECKTVNSTCSVSFFSQEPRPANGLVRITAYAIGEESFIDRNGNNAVDSTAEMVDINGVSSDIGEAYIDVDGNQVYTPGVDIPIDFNGNGVYDGPDGQYNGTLCVSGFSGCSSRRFTHVYGMTSIVLSISQAAPRYNYVDVSSGYPDSSTQQIALGCNSSASIGIYVRDPRGNILPAGSEVTFKLSGSSSSAFALGAPSTFRIPNTAPAPGSRLAGMTIFPIRVFSPALEEETVTNADGSTTTSMVCKTGKTADLSAEIGIKSADGSLATYSTGPINLIVQ